MLTVEQALEAILSRLPVLTTERVDVLAAPGYGLAPHTRADRAHAFTYKHAPWLRALPTPAAAALEALSDQFARAGTDGLENPHVFQLPRVQQAGGLPAFRALGRPADVLRETKERLFAP